MRGNIVAFPNASSMATDVSHNQLITTDYDEAMQHFARLLKVENLDENLHAHRSPAHDFERTLGAALLAAYHEEADSDAAHLFLQRVLYRINRLKLFWYDDLHNYANERSAYLRLIRDQIEEAWQRWELAQLDIGALKKVAVREALIERAAADLDPSPSTDALFFRDQVSERGYRRLLEIVSLDGLVEASQLSRTLGGVGNEIHSMLTRLLLEEYGGGRLARKHSSYFTAMLEVFDMQTEPEAYFNRVPWEVLATINHSFLLSERKRYYLRYIGGLLYTEVSVPAAFRHYQRAAERLGLADTAMGYWALHIREDERHGRWMLHDVALPLAERYAKDAWELVFGYDQQRLMSGRAGAAIARAAREAEQETQPQFMRATGQ